MSSRAAGGRQRLTAGDKEDQRSPKAPKGFLSRFKSTKTAVDSQTGRSLHSSGQHAFDVDPAATTLYDSHGSLEAKLSQTTRNSFSSVTPRSHPNQPTEVVSDFKSEDQYEVSYQPPPPTSSPYQPSPFGNATMIQGRRPLPSLPQSAPQPPSHPGPGAISDPPSYAPSHPTPTTFQSFQVNPIKSPAVQSSSSSSSRTNSPAPTYTSFAMPMSMHALPRLQVPRSDLKDKSSGHDKYTYGNPSHPPSSSSNPIVLSYAPLSPSSQSTPSDYYSASDWPRPATVSQPPIRIPPSRPSSVGPGPPKSTSGSSSSSRRYTSIDLARNAGHFGPVFLDNGSALSHDSDIDPTTKSSAESVQSGGSGEFRPSVPPSGYVFPVGRSRAQPSKPSTIAKNRSDKSKAADIVNEDKTRNFIGLPLKKKLFRGSVDLHKERDVISPFSKEVIDIHSPQAPMSLEDVPTPGESLETNHEESYESVLPDLPQIGTYPFDPYDPALLESDLYTTKLLGKINSTHSSPTFFNYGNTPPTSVLDLGCGQGHWIIDAAVAWKGYGTRVVGFDMADFSQVVLSRAIEHGVMENVNFVQGNFLEDSLPFGDESFDLVRMSCLTLCIPSEFWTFVLQEVHRVLMSGGRLELIDDTVVFPYLSTPPTFDGRSVKASADPERVLPQLNINIPSATLSRTSSTNSTFARGSLSTAAAEAWQIRDLSLVADEPDVDDTRTIYGVNVGMTVGSNSNITQQTAKASSIDSPSWNNAVKSSQNLEGLFEHMLLHRSDIRTNSTDFLAALLKEVFGYEREMHDLQLSLASSGTTPSGSGIGLVLSRSTHLPMDQAETLIHATRYIQLLLSCKDILVEHAKEVFDYEHEIRRSVLEALEDYERFLLHRLGFSPPSNLWEAHSGCLETGSPIMPGALHSGLSYQSTSAPPVSLDLAAQSTGPNLTLVRKFRIYEAIRIDKVLFGVST